MVSFGYFVQIGRNPGWRKKAPRPHKETDMKDGHPGETCQTISELLSRVGDKWTIQVIGALGDGPMRFNALKREITDISQKMLSTTLRNLERDGFVSREVEPTTPPRVTYALTDLGRELATPVFALAQWTGENAQRILDARAAYALRNP